MDIATIIAAASVEGIIGLAIYLGIRRPLDQISQENNSLRSEVAHLRDDQVKGLTDKVEKHEKRFGYIERGYVPDTECNRRHVESRDISQKVLDAAIQIAGVQKDADRAIEWIKETATQLISAREDVAGITARLEAMEARMNRREGMPQ